MRNSAAPVAAGEKAEKQQQKATKRTKQNRPLTAGGLTLDLCYLLLKFLKDDKDEPALKEPEQERGRFIRDAGDLVRGLTIEFEIELGLGSAVVPVGKTIELAPADAPLRECGAPDGDGHARRLPGDPAFLRDRFGRGDDAAGDETRPAFVLARDDENRITLGDALATIHRFLRVERECLRPRIANLDFDHKYHGSNLQLINVRLGELELLL
jgi:hypothetical protein